MRKIKFRAWICDGGGFDDQKGYVTPGMEYNPIFWFPHESGDVSCSDYFSDKSVLAWMQFTGMLDFNGVEIYEGDIVYQNTFYGKILGVVTYDDKQSRFVVADGSDAKSFKRQALWGNGIVLGNIYENPEMLGEELC
jgi:uncharacterized phage protein (TIGR01671 family)